jgi:hypothetical protein
MKTKFAFVAALAAFLSTLTAMAQNTATLIADGRAELVDGNWTAASADFLAAGNLTPTSVEAQTLAAISEVVAVWQTPALEALGEEYGFDFGSGALPPKATPIAGGPTADANASDAQAYVVGTLLPIVQDANARLTAAITAIQATPSMTISLSGNETMTGTAVALDQGDLLMLRTFAEGFISAAFLSKAVNLNAVIVDFINLSKNNMLDPEDVRQAYPQLFGRPAGTAAASDLSAAQSAFTSVGTLYSSASFYIRVKRSDPNALFQLHPSGLAGEAKFRAELALVMASVTKPTAIKIGNPPTVVQLSLASVFSGNANFVQLVPAFIGSKLIASSIPDPTFGGIFSNGNTTFWKNAAAKGTELFIPYGTAAFSTQPKSGTVGSGGNTTLTAALSGNPSAQYYWTLNNVFLANGANYSGVSTPTLTITGVNANLAGIYRLIAVTSSNDTMIYSASSGAAVNVTPVAPNITAQPSSLTVTSPAQASFTVVATGMPLLYQWTFNGKAITASGNITGTTSPQLLISNTTAANAGKYACVVSNAKGKATSKTAVLTVLIPPSVVSLTTSPKSLTSVKSGTAVSFTVKAAGTTPLTYQWMVNGNPVINGSGISGNTSVTLKISKATVANNGNYRVVINNASKIPVNSVPVMLTVGSSLP